MKGILQNHLIKIHTDLYMRSASLLITEEISGCFLRQLPCSLSGNESAPSITKYRFIRIDLDNYRRSAIIRVVP